MRFGVTYFNKFPMGPTLLAEMAQSVEEAGFESIWVSDHLALQPGSPAYGQGGSRSPRLIGPDEVHFADPLSTLAYLAGTTRTVRLGTSVLVLPLRERWATAKSLATIQKLSDGRLMLGVGAGWHRPEFQAIGSDYEARKQRLVADAAFFRELWGASGEWPLADGGTITSSPTPDSMPPILAGVSSVSGATEAAAWADGLILSGPSAGHCMEAIRAGAAGSAPADEFSVTAKAPEGYGIQPWHRSATRLLVPIGGRGIEHCEVARPEDAREVLERLRSEVG